MLYWLLIRKGFLIFSNAFQGLWRWTFRIILKYHFLHVPPNTKMSLTPVKIKHPLLPAFTLFLCLVISIEIIIRQWLPESEAVLFHLGCCNEYHRPSSIWTAEIYFLTSYRYWEVQDQGEYRFHDWWGTTFWFIGGLFSAHSHLLEGVRGSPRPVLQEHSSSWGLCLLT